MNLQFAINVKWGKIYIVSSYIELVSINCCTLLNYIE